MGSASPLKVGFLVLCSLVALIGCRKEPPAPVVEEAVARVGDGAITLDDVKAKLSEQPAFVRARYDSPEKKREFVDSLVRFELLAQEARRRGLDQDPEVQAMLEKVLVQRLVQTVAEEAGASVEDAEARAFYDANLQEYVRPEQVRVRHLFLSAPSDAEGRARRKAEAAQLLASLKRPGTPDEAFEEAVRAHSEDLETKGVGGDTGLRTREELESRGGSALAQNAFSLRTVGEVGTLVESERGFHLVKLIARQPALEQSFESVKPRIVNRLSAERRSKAVDELIASLRESTSVTIDDAMLEKLDVRALANEDAAP